MTPLANALVSAIVAISTGIVLSVWRVVIVLLIPSMQGQPSINVCKSSPPELVGGGSADKQLDACGSADERLDTSSTQVIAIAQAIQRTLGHAALELLRQPKPLDDVHEKQPKLLRVADRMRLWPGRNPRQRSLERPKTLMTAGFNRC